MNPEAAVVFGILGVAGVMFASGRVRLDITALLVVLALMLSGILTPRQALAGFGDPVVPLVAGLLVVGEMLTRTGIAYAIGGWLMRAGGSSETRMLTLLMLSAGGLGAVMSSTAVVAIFIPVVITISAKTKLNAARLLMPLSFAALVSGMLTLIATTPNLVVSAELASRGLQPFTFFSFTPIGAAVLLVAVGYFLLIGRRLLPGEMAEPARSEVRTLEDLAVGYGLSDKRHRLRVPDESSLVGRTLAEGQLDTQFGVRVLGIKRLRRFLGAPGPDAEIHAGDVLVCVAEPEAITQAAEAHGCTRLSMDAGALEETKEHLGLAVVLVHPEAHFLGQSIHEIEFRSNHGLHVLGLRRHGELIDDFLSEPLLAGDAMLLAGDWAAISQAQHNDRDFVVLALAAEHAEIAPARDRAPWALAILAGMVVLSALELVPVVAAVLMAALAAVFARTLTMDDGYRAIHWSALVLIAGMLPVADALEQTGGVDMIVDVLVVGLGDATPYFVMTVIFFITAGLGLVLSNTATAVLLAPIAIRAAEVVDVSPYPLAMTVAIAASAAFVTPVSTPVVTLVVAPGGYGFLDFVKVGMPLLVLTWLTTLLVTPLVFPF